MVVVAGATLEGERLVEGDLDAVDVVAVPDRLEDPVGEAQAGDVLDRLLLEEVVDPVDRALGRRLGEQLVERPEGFSTTMALPSGRPAAAMAVMAAGNTGGGRAR